MAGRERDGGAHGLGGPAGHVAKQVYGEGDIGYACDGDGLAVIEGFKLGKLIGVLLQQISQTPDELARGRWD